MDHEKRYALLIDADNISPRYLSIMLNEAKSYGIVNIRRIYGDWTDPGKKSWKDSLLDNSIIPIQQYSYTTGKNASDSAMIIDAMDILYTGNVDGFIVASSDSDFTRLVMRIRESGKKVIGMGESKTPASFVKACEEFKVLDVLFKNTLSVEEQKRANKTVPHVEEKEEEITPITKLKDIKRAMLTILDKNSDEEGKMLLSELGRLLTKMYPDFDARNYGRYRKFIDFVSEMKELEVEMVYSDDKKMAPVAFVMLQKKEATK